MPIIHVPDPTDPPPWWQVISEPFGWVLAAVLALLVVAGATELLVHPTIVEVPHGISDGVSQ